MNRHTGTEDCTDDDPNDRNDHQTDGGLEVRDLNAVRHSADLVREYRTPPGDRLYAYRSDDGDHHIVVSRGSDPGTKWERRVPATVERPVPGQKRWTIPDNWEQRVQSKRDTIKYGLFFVPESETFARVSIPTNNWLTDAWYHVKAVGRLAVGPVGDLGSKHDVRSLANQFAGEHDFDRADTFAAKLHEVADNWDVIEEDLDMTTDWVRDEGLDKLRCGDQPVHADEDWQIEFSMDYIFRPAEALKSVIDFGAEEPTVADITRILDDDGLLPDRYSFELTIDDSVIDMEHHIRGLIEAGASPAAAVDYYMVEIEGMTQTAWAEERGVDQSTVSENVSQARSRLE